MYVAILDTGNFRFMAAGHTATAARTNIARGLAHHFAEQDVVWNWNDWSDAINVTEIHAGECFRDDTKVADL